MDFVARVIGAMPSPEVATACDQSGGALASRDPHHRSHIRTRARLHGFSTHAWMRSHVVAGAYGVLAAGALAGDAAFAFTGFAGAAGLLRLTSCAVAFGPNTTCMTRWRPRRVAGNLA